METAAEIKFKQSEWQKSPEEWMNECRVIATRLQRWIDTMFSTPLNVPSTYYYDTALGINYVKIFIDLDRGDWDSEKKEYAPPTEENTLRAIEWCKFITGVTGEKNIRSEAGTIYYCYQIEKVEDEFGTYHLLILLEHCNPLTCKITKTTVEKEVFEIQC